ncbi:hydroxyisourate hydrolase [Aeromicrobium alkaliterrae]|uniref:5-hydroxyisourate hydrolase n=1 Tax=Aeromicrobium alkaliterrae TaxID=302168 RepID=A0ABP4VYX6_9ACTN
MPTLSTHVLDAALGTPAAGLAVDLVDTDGALLESATTDADGRIAWSVAPEPAVVRLQFATGPWFGAAGRDTFYPAVEVTVGLSAEPAHAHVALLLSPFAYTTYRGS